MAPNCPYEVLGVKRGSVDKEIKDAYRSLVLKYHPDKFANASEHQRIQAKRKFQEIAEAFETLGDRASRNRYDSRGEKTVQYRYSSQNCRGRPTSRADEKEG